ncbi:hypothetical protein ACE6H2_005575 [Prunus campanulata]
MHHCRKMNDKVLPCFPPSYWLRLYGLTSISVQLQELTNNAAKHARLWIGRGTRAARQDQRRLERLLGVEALMTSLQDPEHFSF